MGAGGAAVVASVGGFGEGDVGLTEAVGETVSALHILL